jgi:hypothetical protein
LDYISGARWGKVKAAFLNPAIKLREMWDFGESNKKDCKSARKQPGIPGSQAAHPFRPTFPSGEKFEMNLLFLSLLLLRFILQTS